MAELSPQAQAVLDAYSAAADFTFHESLDFWGVKAGIAAALRAAADQVVPPALVEEFHDRNPSLPLQMAVEIRAELLAIAAELEGQP